MGLFDFWRKKESKPSGNVAAEETKHVPTESAKSAKKTTSRKKESRPKPAPGPDPLQLAVEKIATRPPGEFILFDRAATSFPRRILELGMDDCQRIVTLLQFGVLIIPPTDLLYVGLDWFEDRSADQKPGLSYTKALQAISSLGVKTKLQPGDPAETFLPIANMLTSKKVDWVMISSEIKPKAMRGLWSLFPRILKPDTLFFLEKNGEYKLISPEEVERIAKKADALKRK